MIKKGEWRKIFINEIVEAGIDSIIIQDYPDDKYSPSFLIFGYTNNARPLHIQVSISDSNNIKIITVYQPDVNEWINHIERKK